MRITRKDVLDAIEREPLMGGDWVGYAMDGQCPVCAVGAVLRGQGVADCDIPARALEITKGVCCSDNNLVIAMVDGNWLSALSIKWERLLEVNKPSPWWCWSPKDTARFKGELKNFVLANFPEVVLE